VAAATPTRLWITNPTGSEIAQGLSAGAVGCTTNPSYGGSLLRRQEDFVRKVIASAVSYAPEESDATIAERVQQRLVARIAESFRPIYDRSDAKWGYVSLQGSPLLDDKTDEILRGARAGRAVASNVALKIPATEPGLLAFEALVAEGSTCVVTEVFSVAQLREANERYLRVTALSGRRPPFFISPITGILGDHLRKVAARDAVEVDPKALRLAGVALARRCYAETVARSYPARLLFGGARSTDDFTGLVGGATAATINYSTIKEVVGLNPAVERTVDRPVPGSIVGELRAEFEDFRIAWGDVPMSVAEFESFGPVQHFRSSFVEGWEALLSAIAACRARVGAGTRCVGEHE
jgi:transaldolase